jgi:hypothetical protein
VAELEAIAGGDHVHIADADLLLLLLWSHACPGRREGYSRAR